MISLGRRDASKDPGLGFGGGREMDDSELEEGEACSDHNNDGNYDASIDPDIALSYIDEKLQDVLGHFQKDFEGGVSAENLGTKYGGYGSFLPTYQRSPVWSHTRTPPKVQHHNGPRSPNSSQLEVGRRGSVSSSSVLRSGNLEPASASAMSLISSKATSSPVVTVKQVGVPSTSSAKEHVLRSESIKRKSVTLPDQRMLKVRIKVGSDNLSTQKNAAIYSGLGLDVSPSSSLDDSPSASEGISHGPQGSTFESPARILRIMTSSPVPGGILLSPLPNHLIHLKEKEKLHQGSELSLTFPVCLDNSSLNNGSDSLKGDGKMKKFIDRSEISKELKSENNKDSWSDVDVFPKKMELDTLACEELVSDTLKLPILSNSNPVTDVAKGMVRASNMSGEAYKGASRDKGFSEFMKDEHMGPMNADGDSLVENTKTTSAGRIWEGKKSSSFDSVSVYPRKDGHRKGEKPCDIVKGNPNILKGTKAASSELTGTPKHKVAFRELEGTKLSSGKDCSSSEGKKKPKGNANIVSGMPKDILAGALMAKNKKSTSVDDYSIEGELEDAKSQKNTGRVGDRYKDFFGDIELDQEEIQMSPLEMGYEDRHKDLDVSGEKGTHFSSNGPRERPIGKKVDKLLRTQENPKTTFPPGSVSGPILDTALPAAAPAAAEDNWVCCDKCQKWRLLPLGKNPNDLPEKWLCSMLNWLPGMNRCSFSEEETSNAVMALNQVPTLGGQNNMQINPGDVSSLTSVGNQLDQNHQIYGSQTMAFGGKKKTYKDGPALLSNTMKKNVPLFGLNVVNQPMVEYDILKPSKSSDLAVENLKLKQRDKHKVLDNCSDGGDSRKSKMKSKRDSEKELFRVSKKLKSEGLPEDWVSDPVNIEKIGARSTNSLLTNASGKNLVKNNGCSSSKYQASARKPEENPISMGDMPLGGKRDDKEVGKKRKIKETPTSDAQANAGSLSNTGHNLQGSRILAKEEFSENEYRKEKKAKISRSDGKESSESKGNGKTDKKGSHRKSQQLGQEAGSSVSQRSLDGAGCLKRDSGSKHTSVAATSSSSKVSGSHKTKANFHETKGSPVESVSSSPLRVSKQGKPKSGCRTSTDKYDSTDDGCFTLGGRQSCSHGEDGGSNRSGTAKKFFDVGHHGSLESSVHGVLDRDLSHSVGKAKQQVVPSPDVTDHHITNDGAEYFGQDCQYLNKTSTPDQSRDDHRQQENHYHANGSRPRKSGKVSSSRSKDKNKNLNYELDNSKVKVSDSINEQGPFHEVKKIEGRSKIEEKLGVRSDESENRYVDKTDSVGLLSSGSSKKESQSKFQGYNGNHDDTSIPKQRLQPDSEAVSGRGKSPSLPPSGGAHNETLSHCPLPVSGSQKASRANIPDSDNGSKALKQIRKVDHANGTHRSGSRAPLSNGHRAGDLDAPSPVKRDSSGQAATNALKEAKNLKHLADRLKNSGSNDSTKIYFEAALKFLHGASLLENGEMIQSMHVYSTTAKLCEFCAHEYEKSKDVAAAALAYKCTEVAYMRVVHSSQASAIKDRDELRTALQMVPPGESPSSSASDVDNLNHPATLDKGPLAKGISSPQVAASHVIAARHRPNFARLLNFVQEVNFAMEASRKSRIALAATSANLGESQRRENISLIKTALDFNFQDVEGLLRLVRLALEAISR
ncbi:cysteine-tryptophan domain-containing zinc finger protein 7-like isoform X2 [Euphorbia lathyris]|uniref:cysteine-tryptophan domain-containing zinc finger protein 7-like isoform X2 n=1 Tax=Euphorbia lathyris TaxID=212925 RepID=UPI0033137A25